MCHYDSGVDIFYIFIYGEHLCGRDQSLFWTLCLSLSLLYNTWHRKVLNTVSLWTIMTKEVHSSSSRSWHNSTPPSWHLTSTTPWIKYLNSSMWHHLPMITWQISPPPLSGLVKWLCTVISSISHGQIPVSRDTLETKLYYHQILKFYVHLKGTVCTDENE